MKPRLIRDRVHLLASVDWDRRLFDSLIPLPDGTSYNAYLVRGSEKTALVDSTDPAMVHQLMGQLSEVFAIDYIVSNHTEQDHSGVIPILLDKYPASKVLCTPKAKPMLIEHLGLDEGRIVTVADGETLSLGDKTLEFVHTPWVHWPETMCTYLQEDRILFSCDFFGSHLATSELYVPDERIVYEAAKRYYAEIMMPFRKTVAKNLEKVRARAIDLVAPSHGPIYDRPGFIFDAYHDWTTSPPRNLVIVPYVSMHGSTRRLVEALVTALAERQVEVIQFDLSSADIGKLAIALVDAATVVFGTPTVHAGPHPAVFYAAHLANALRPKLRFASVVGSFGWSSKAIEQISNLVPHLQIELLPGVLCKGLPRAEDLQAVEALAERIARLHREAGLLN